MGRAFDGAYFGVENNRHMREHSGSAVRRARAALRCAAALALLALAATGCGDGAGKAQPETSDANGTAIATAQPAWTPETALRDLLAPPDVSFAVTFQWQSSDQPPYSGAVVVWRQGSGVRRLDWVGFKSGEPNQGEFSIEGRPPGQAAVPYDAMGCDWWVLNAGNADISCTEGSGGGRLGLLSLPLMYLAKDRLPDRSIAGGTASCYRVDVRYDSATEVCLDPSGVLLYLSMKEGPNSPPVAEIRALSVSMAEQTLDFPIELEKEPVFGDWVLEGEVPLSTLDLPDLSQFQN